MPGNVQGIAWALFPAFSLRPRQLTDRMECLSLCAGCVCSADTQQAWWGRVRLVHGHPFWLPEGVCGEGATWSWGGKVGRQCCSS